MLWSSFLSYTEYRTSDREFVPRCVDLRAIQSGSEWERTGTERTTEAHPVLPFASGPNVSIDKRDCGLDTVSRSTGQLRLTKHLNRYETVVSFECFLPSNVHYLPSSYISGLNPYTGCGTFRTYTDQKTFVKEGNLK